MQLQVFHMAVMLLFLVVFAEASLSKIIARETPQWFVDQFKETWLGKLAPVPLMYWTIAIFELAIAVLFVIAAVQMEFLPSVANEFTGWGALAAMVLFTILCFGQRVAMDYAGAASSFFYAGISGMLWYVITNLPK